MTVVSQAVKDFGPMLIAATTAGFGLATYRKNANTRRAEFLVALHQSFFVDEQYKQVRQLLDSDEEAQVAELATQILAESEQLTDFLNFFELVAYLYKTDNLSQGDLNALLGYYLRRLNRHPDLRRYVSNQEKSFEHLSALLAKLGSRANHD